MARTTLLQWVGRALALSLASALLAGCAPPTASRLALWSLERISSKVEGDFSSAVWSPDGTKVAFVHGRNAGSTREMWVMGSDGSSPQQVYQAKRTPAIVGWSSVGDQILFLVVAADVPMKSTEFVFPRRFYLLDADSGEVKQVGQETFYGVGTRASWNHNLGKIAFSMKGRTGGQNDLYVLDVEGTELKKVTNTPGLHEGLPTWSPDGTKLAFYIQTVEGEGDEIGPEEGLLVMEWETGKTWRVAATPVQDTITWSPDGKWIAYRKFWKDPQRYYNGIFIVRSDGSGEPKRVSPDVPLMEPQWSPTGNKLLVASVEFGRNNLYLLDLEKFSQE